MRVDSKHGAEGPLKDSCQDQAISSGLLLGSTVLREQYILLLERVH